MPPEQLGEHLLEFFKVLAEPHRLKIIGLLAEEPRTVGQIGTLLGVSVSTASHHLSRLSDAGLVSATARGYYSIYALRTDVLRTMAKTLLQQTEQPRRETGESMDAFDRKVLESFTTPKAGSGLSPCRRKNSESCYSMS